MANGILTRAMQLLVRHAELSEAARALLPPPGFDANTVLCLSMLNEALTCFDRKLDETDVSGLAASDATALSAALQHHTDTRAALASHLGDMQQQGYQLSLLKLLLASELQPCVEAVAACCRALQPFGGAPAGSPWPALADPPTEQGLLAVTAALTTRPGCSNLQCTNCAGAEEGSMPRGQRCSGCLTQRFCSAACQRQAWPQHRAACRLLAAGSAAGS